ncbi:MAG TPA: PadR family transcriptional regulator [Acidobacteria bacterium]|nr:PadR family transcriptional regulator [Acidobacteriota bacterium]
MKMDLLQGTLDVLILKALSWGPLHGYAVVRWIERTTEEVLRIEEGALYPALHRMERRGWIEAEWGMSEKNRKAKFYKLTDLGRRELHAESATWHRYAQAVGKVLQAAQAV